MGLVLHAALIGLVLRPVSLRRVLFLLLGLYAQQLIPHYWNDLVVVVDIIFRLLLLGVGLGLKIFVW